MPLVPEDKMAVWGLLVYKVLRDHLEHLVRLASLVHQELPACLVKLDL